MNAMLLPAVLLAALHVLWFLAFLADARSGRHADPIGRILSDWLEDDPSPAPLGAPLPERRRLVAAARGNPPDRGDLRMGFPDDTLLARPLVYATPGDLRRLRQIAGGGDGPGGRLLAEEVDRIAIACASAPPRFVRLGAHVTYLDLRTKRRRRVRVVPPDAAASEENHVSVTSPIGAALIGLPQHAVFRWRADGGGAHAVRVILVEPEPEVRSGRSAAPAPPRDRLGGGARARPRPPTGPSRPADPSEPAGRLPADHPNRPPVHVVAEEYESLADLVCGAPRATPGLALLWQELQRAFVTPGGRVPADLVRMGSRVTFTDVGRREARTVRLVHPADVLQPIRVSVTSLTGAALLGLRTGALFEWLQDDGEMRRLRVDAVEEPLGPRITPARRTA